MISVFAVSCLFGIGVQANHINGKLKFNQGFTDWVTDDYREQMSDGNFKFKSY